MNEINPICAEAISDAVDEQIVRMDDGQPVVSINNDGSSVCCVGLPDFISLVSGQIRGIEK